MRSLVHAFDKTITGWISAMFGPGWRPFFEFITTLGDPITVVLVTAAVMVAGLYQSSVRLVISGAIIPLTVGLGALLKLLFERARPLSDYSANLATFSFPSGHSSGSMIAYGLLAYIAFMKLPEPWNIAGAIILGLIPVAVGVSRVYLGAHYPSDVVAGWLLGMIGLAVVILVVRPLA